MNTITCCKYYTESVEVFVNYYTESVEVLATVVLSFNIPWQSDYSIHCFILQT